MRTQETVIQELVDWLCEKTNDPFDIITVGQLRERAIQAELLTPHVTSHRLRAVMRRMPSIRNHMTQPGGTGKSWYLAGYRLHDEEEDGDDG